MTVKTTKNDANNRGNEELNRRLRSLWLGREFLKITFSDQENDSKIDVQEIRQLLDESSSDTPLVTKGQA